MSDSSSNNTDNLDDNRQGVAGTISGFDTINLISDPTFSESDLSAAVLGKQLQDLIATWSAEKWRQTQRMILSHINDENNPHHDTIANLTQDDLASLFQKFVPGTVPLRPPVTSYKAAMEMGSPFSSLIVSRESEINVIDEQGFLRYHGPNEITPDWSYGYPTIPCWPTVNQLIDIIDIDNNTDYVLGNVVLGTAYNTGIIPPMFSSQVSLIETAGQTSYSLTYNKAGILTPGHTYTHSFFFYPSGYQTGSVYLDIGDLGTVVFNIADPRTYVISGNFRVYVCKLPNGWFRIGVSFVADKANVSLQTGYDPHSYSAAADVVASVTNGNRVYIGTSGTTIFSLFGPQLVDVPGLPPLIQTRLLAPTTLTYTGFDNAISLITGMMHLRYQLYQGNTNDESTTLLSIPNVLTIATDGTNAITSTLNIRSTPITMRTTANDASLNAYALSFSANKVSIQTTTDARQDQTDFQQSAFQAITAIQTINFGPFFGGIVGFEQYAVEDDKDALSFLIGA